MEDWKKARGYEKESVNFADLFSLDVDNEEADEIFTVSVMMLVDTTNHKHDYQGDVTAELQNTTTT